MECGCRKRIEKALTEQQIKALPESRDVDVRLQAYAMVLEGNALLTKPCMPVEVRHTKTVKKTGAEKQYRQTMNMVFSFCPFCGVSLKADKP